MINLFANLKKELYKSTKSNIELATGMGASIIRTDARNPFYFGADHENKYETVTSLLISPGIQWNHNFSEKAKISFGLNLHYSPYKIESALREEVGAVGVIPKILYTF